MTDGDAAKVVQAARQFGSDRGYHRYAIELSATSKEWDIPADRYDVARHFMARGFF